MSKDRFGKFKGLTFDKFEEMAKDKNLSNSEKIGFPDDLREQYTGAIFESICSKVPAVKTEGTRLIDIGIGCGELGQMIVQNSRNVQNHLTCVDGPAMLKEIEEGPYIDKVVGRFPDCAEELLAGNAPFDGIIIYSVLQHVILELNPFDFVDAVMSLLAPGGRALIADIPNVSMLQRFLLSVNGKAYHYEYMNTDKDPEVELSKIERSKIDDSIVIGLMQRARAAGFQAWITPQTSNLPFYQRREDLIIAKP